MRSHPLVRLLALMLALTMLTAVACKGGGKEEIPEQADTSKLEKDSGEKVAAVIPDPDDAFAALNALGKPKWNKVVEPIEKTEYSDDSQTALVTGMVLTDFFVYVHAEDTKAAGSELTKVVDLARQLKVKVDKDDLKTVREHLKKKEWGELRSALGQLRGKMTDQLVEEMKRPDLAFLLSLGAYVEGTWVVSKVLSDDYSKKAATMLRQHELIKDVRESNDVLKKDDKYGKLVLGKLGKLEKLMTVEKGASVSEKNTKKIFELAKDTKQAILE